MRTASIIAAIHNFAGFGNRPPKNASDFVKGKSKGHVIPASMVDKLHDSLGKQ